MSKLTSRWKRAEKGGEALYQEFLIPAERITRAGNYAESTYDIRINGFPEYKTDSKYSIKGHATSRMLDVVEEKYCERNEDEPILVCKGYRERGFKVTIRGRFFAMLLSYFLGFADKETLLSIYRKEKE